MTMDAKSLKKLNRRELLEIMVSISEENEALTHENEVLKAEIENRKLSAKEVGSLAQASLEANNFFIAADNAAKLYLENVARMEQEAKDRSSRLLEETLTECMNMRAKAGFSGDDLLPENWGAEGSIEAKLIPSAQSKDAEGETSQADYNQTDALCEESAETEVDEASTTALEAAAEETNDSLESTETPDPAKPGEES